MWNVWRPYGIAGAWPGRPQARNRPAPQSWRCRGQAVRGLTRADLLMPQNVLFGAFATDRQPTAEAAPNGGSTRVLHRLRWAPRGARLRVWPASVVGHSGPLDTVDCIYRCTLDTISVCLLRRLGSRWR